MSIFNPDPDERSLTYGVNSSGTVVAISAPASDYYGFAYIRSLNANIPIPNVPPDSGSSAPVPGGINDSARAVGYDYIQRFGQMIQTELRPWWFDAQTRQKNFISVFPDGATLNGVNNLGEAVGETGLELIRSFVYNTGTSSYRMLGGDDARAQTLNNQGIVVGYQYTRNPYSPRYRAVYWNIKNLSPGQIPPQVYLSDQNSQDSYAYDVTDTGAIVGAIRYTNGENWIVKWDSPGATPQKIARVDFAAAEAFINGSGQIVGNNTEGPFIFRPGKGISLISDLVGSQLGDNRILAATGLSSAGYISLILVNSHYLEEAALAAPRELDK